MTSTRTAYVQAAAAAADLLNDPAVAAAWDKASALPEFGVGGLAGHLARQVLGVPVVLSQPAPAERPIGLLDHYDRSAWVDAGVHDEVNVTVRRYGDAEAADGPAALVARVGAVLAALPDALAAEPTDRVVHLPWGPWALSLDDYLVTRMMEIAVHRDDLAVSVGIDTPPLPRPASDAALALLVRLAVRRHGEAGVLRALSRAERAPATIAAF